MFIHTVIHSKIDSALSGSLRNILIIDAAPSYPLRRGHAIVALIKAVISNLFNCE